MLCLERWKCNFEIHKHRSSSTTSDDLVFHESFPPLRSVNVYNNRFYANGRARLCSCGTVFCSRSVWIPVEMIIILTISSWFFSVLKLLSPIVLTDCLDLTTTCSLFIHNWTSRDIQLYAFSIETACLKIVSFIYLYIFFWKSRNAKNNLYVELLKLVTKY